MPVTVKIRSGLRDGDGRAGQLAPRLVEAGVAAVCIHPRTAAQLYRGHADHAVTRALAAELPVPVIASGDVDGRAAALALLERRRRGGDAGPRRPRAPLAVRRGAGRGRPPAAAVQATEEVRRFAAEALDEHRRPRRRPPAPVLAEVPPAAAPSTSRCPWR